MSKGSNSTTTNSSSSIAPNSEAMKYYQEIMSRAQSAADKPYQGYGGEFVAPINQQQQMGVANINTGANGFAPWAAQAGQNIGEGTTAVNQNDINRYMDPYTQQVIDATTADFDTQNKRALTNVEGNAGAQGALGGNRVGVAEALSREAASRPQAPSLAGLRSHGVPSAVANANAQKARQITGGQAEASTGMQEAGMQVGAGTLEQQTKQAQDTAQMQEYFRQQGYDFQTAQFLAGIALPTGSQMGSSSTGTSATQGPQPNTWAQIAGLGVAGLGAFSKSDARMKENIEEVGKTHDGQKIYRYNFKGDPTTQIGLISQEVEKSHPDAVRKVNGVGMVDYEAATDDAVKRANGGPIIVRGFAAGGTPWGEGGAPWSGGVGWVPNVQLQGRALNAPAFPQHAKMDGQKDPLAGVGKSLGTIGKGLYDNWPSSPVESDQMGGSGMSADLGGSWDTGGLSWARGGGVARRRGYADGGFPVATGMGGGSYLEGDDGATFEERVPRALMARQISPVNDQLRGAGERSLREAPGALSEPNFDTPKVVQTERIQPTGFAPSAEPEASPIVAQAKKVFAGLPKVGVQDDATDEPLSYAARPGVSGAAPPRPLEGEVLPPNRNTMGGFNPLGMSDQARQGLISMGLAMMANRRGGPGSFLASVGEGGEAGMNTYASAMSATAQRDLEQQKLEQARLLHSTMTPYQKAQIERENLQYIGNNDDGYPIYLDKRSGKETVGATKVQGKAPPGYVRNPDGSMSAVKGGPADPEIVAGIVKAKSGAQIPDATADFLAERVLNGDTKALVGMGRGAQGAENIIRIQTLVAQKAAERGVDARDILARIAEQSGLTASQRTFGTQIARMAVNSTEAEGAIQQGLEVSKNVPRTKFVPVNKLVQMAEANISDPDLLEFRAANLAIINTYARAISPTGQPTIHDKEEAMKIVSEATSPEAYERVMRRMLKEIAIAHAAPATAKKELERIRKSSSVTEPEAPVTPTKVLQTVPTQSDIDFVKAHPETRDKFIKRFGREP